VSATPNTERLRWLFESWYHESEHYRDPKHNAECAFMAGARAALGAALGAAPSHYDLPANSVPLVHCPGCQCPISKDREYAPQEPVPSEPSGSKLVSNCPRCANTHWCPRECAPPVQQEGEVASPDALERLEKRIKEMSPSRFNLRNEYKDWVLAAIRTERSRK